tara:strand:- start:657 stop:1520 length:864 start_codon:yes stop_codon:yes gene_type:complete
MTARTTPYLIGYTIKPSDITPLGQVMFTDGTNNEIRANQKQCEAYGYTYDRASGTCIAFRYNTALDRDINNINNKFNGVGNTTQFGTNTVQINGTHNKTEGLNNNCFINGSDNTIANGVNNSTVVGTLAEATATSSIVLGGNAVKDDLGERQNITVMFGTTTTDNTTTEAWLNNSQVASYFEIPVNSVIAFQTETIGVRTGGSAAGSVGDFKAFIEVGAAVSDSGGAITVDKSRTTIANVGTTSGWVSNVVESGGNFVQTVKGANNRTIEWVTTMRITQLKAGVTIP